jgi:hypothetical protein
LMTMFGASAVPDPWHVVVVVVYRNEVRVIEVLREGEVLRHIISVGRTLHDERRGDCGQCHHGSGPQPRRKPPKAARHG